MNPKKTYMSTLRTLINQEKKLLAEKDVYQAQLRQLNNFDSRIKACMFRFFADSRTRNLDIAHFHIGRIKKLLSSIEEQIKESVVLQVRENAINKQLLTQMDLYDVHQMEHSKSDEKERFIQALQEARNAVEELSTEEFNDIFQSHQ